MGQYYLIILLKDAHTTKNPDIECIRPFFNSLKMMEHSYINNSTMLVIENLLQFGERWYKGRIVWAGDYGKSEDGDEGPNLYTIANETTVGFNISDNDNDLRYIINHDKKLYVDKHTLKEDNYGLTIHPLPLLTKETDDWTAGGDFRGEDSNNLCGSWARDSISMGTKIPTDYQELIFDLMES